MGDIYDLIDNKSKEVNKFIYPEKLASWKKHFKDLMGDSFDDPNNEYYEISSQYLDDFIECLEKLENGEDFQKVYEFAQRCNLTFMDILRFSKVGPEFYAYADKVSGANDIQRNQHIQTVYIKTLEENKQLSKLHPSKNNIEKKVDTKIENEKDDKKIKFNEIEDTLNKTDIDDDLDKEFEDINDIDSKDDVKEISDKESNIDKNREMTKEELIQKILEQQKIIARQKEEIRELKSLNKEL